MGNSCELVALCPPARWISFSAWVALHQPTRQWTRHTRRREAASITRRATGKLPFPRGKECWRHRRSPHTTSTNTLRVFLAVKIIKKTLKGSTPGRISPPRSSNAWINLDRRRLRNKNTDCVMGRKRKIGEQELKDFWQDPGHQNWSDCVGLRQQFHEKIIWQSSDFCWSRNLKQETGETLH